MKSLLTRAAFIDFRTGNRVLRRSGEFYDVWYRAIDRIAQQADSEGRFLYLMGAWFTAAQEYSPEISTERWGHLTAYGVAVFRNARNGVVANTTEWE